MKYQIITLIILQIIITINIIPVFADFITTVKNCSIDWEGGHLISKGKASIALKGKGFPVDLDSSCPISINRARRDTYLRARRNAIDSIVEALKSIRIDSETMLDDLIIGSKITQRRLSEIILNSLIVEEYPVDFYTSACKIKLRIGDIIASIPYNFPAHDFPTRDAIPISTHYTGLIVDCRGLDISPMLLPSIYDVDGLEIYGRYYIDSVYICRSGMVSYCYSQKEALESKVAGERPYFAVAIKSIKNCPVLSERDTRRILSSAETKKKLKRCRVIFILDREG